jgi:cytochrome c-type biogenesis protein CcmE
VVAEGVWRGEPVFTASRILAKHDENYMPKEVVEALKDSGEWKGK